MFDVVLEDGRPPSSFGQIRTALHLEHTNMGQFEHPGEVATVTSCLGLAGGRVKLFGIHAVIRPLT